VPQQAMKNGWSLPLLVAILASANLFGVMQVHNLKEIMTKKGLVFASECLIFEVCQPQSAKKVLDENMRKRRQVDWLNFRLPNIDQLSEK
jgi:uncharacterized protein (DUF302 family)